MRDVKYLASELLDGRATGSAGNDSAAEYLAKSYQAMEASALLKTSQCDSTGQCRLSYLQGFKPPVRVLLRAGIDTNARAYNIVAAVSGADATVRGEWLVVGAHYDHLGRTGFGAMDPIHGTDPHLGADDNASGTAAVLELARRLSRSPTRRPVLFVNFSAEELGEIASSVFVLHSPIPLDSIAAMFNFDMVGHLMRERLLLYGLGSSKDWRRILDTANISRVPPLDRRDELGPRGTGSDHEPFYRVGIPVMHFFSGLHDAYHTRDDTYERVDFEGMMKVIDFAERVIRLVGDRNDMPMRSLKP
jgi:Zn-dependent M28 family amino/carboxypeptidase